MNTIHVHTWLAKLTAEIVRRDEMDIETAMLSELFNTLHATYEYQNYVKTNLVLFKDDTKAYVTDDDGPLFSMANKGHF